MGYIVPLVILAAALLVGAYATGYQARKSSETKLVASDAASDMSTMVDPLNLGGPMSSPTTRADERSRPPSSNQPSRQAGAQSATKSPVTLPSSEQKSPSKSAGLIIVTRPDEDPRQAGLNYLIAATLPPDEAEKAGRFLVSKGLEVAVIPGDTTRLNWVVVLQGVAAKDLGSPSVRALEQRLQALGREYRQVHKGPTVFNDPWWKKHTK